MKTTNTKARERIRTAKHCKACRKTTEHERMELKDGTQFLRCAECGQRPDRPKDGTKIKVTCPTCGMKVNGYYFDEDGADSVSAQCPDCGDTIMDYAEAINKGQKHYKKCLAIAQGLANTYLNKHHHIVGGLRVTNVSVTVESATAYAGRE